MRTRLHAFAPVVAIVLAMMTMPACAGKVIKTPADIAHHGTTLVDVATELQRWTTKSVDAGAMPIIVGRAITDFNQEVKTKGDELLASLRLVDAAESLTLRNLAEEQSRKIIAELETQLAKATGLTLPPSLSSEFITFIDRIVKAVESAKTALAATP